jgi:hypothetical protein
MFRYFKKNKVQLRSIKLYVLCHPGHILLKCVKFVPNRIHGTGCLLRIYNGKPICFVNSFSLHPLSESIYYLTTPPFSLAPCRALHAAAPDSRLHVSVYFVSHISRKSCLPHIEKEEGWKMN